MKNALLLLREKKIRPTLARLQILSVLEAADDGRQPVEDIYRALLESGDATSLPTVYRILNKMATAGLLERVWGRDGSESRLYYRLARHDLSPLEHEVVCGKCQRHMMVQLPGLRDDLTRLCQGNDLQPAAAAILIQITCASCLAGATVKNGEGTDVAASVQDDDMSFF